MKPVRRNWPVVLAEVFSCTLVQYALSNMAFLLYANPLVILFFTVKLWMWSSFWRKTDALCGNKVLSAVLTVLCLAAEICLLYYVGHAAGELVPF